MQPAQKPSFHKKLDPKVIAQWAPHYFDTLTVHQIAHMTPAQLRAMKQEALLHVADRLCRVIGKNVFSQLKRIAQLIRLPSIHDNSKPSQATVTWSKRQICEAIHDQLSKTEDAKQPVNENDTNWIHGSDLQHYQHAESSDANHENATDELDQLLLLFPSLVDPISHEIMTDPVMLTSGHIYDAQQLLHWSRSSGVTLQKGIHDPKSGLRVEPFAIPAHTIRQTLREVLLYFLGVDRIPSRYPALWNTSHAIFDLTSGLVYQDAHLTRKFYMAASNEETQTLSSHVATTTNPSIPLRSITTEQARVYLTQNILPFDMQLNTNKHPRDCLYHVLEFYQSQVSLQPAFAPIYHYVYQTLITFLLHHPMLACRFFPTQWIMLDKLARYHEQATSLQQQHQQQRQWIAMFSPDDVFAVRTSIWQEIQSMSTSVHPFLYLLYHAATMMNMQQAIFLFSSTDNVTMHINGSSASAASSVLHSLFDALAITHTQINRVMNETRQWIQRYTPVIYPMQRSMKQELNLGNQLLQCVQLWRQITMTQPPIFELMLAGQEFFTDVLGQYMLYEYMDANVLQSLLHIQLILDEKTYQLSFSSLDNAPNQQQKMMRFDECIQRAIQMLGPECWVTVLVVSYLRMHCLSLASVTDNTNQHSISFEPLSSTDDSNVSEHSNSFIQPLMTTTTSTTTTTTTTTNNTQIPNEEQDTTSHTLAALQFRQPQTMLYIDQREQDETLRDLQQDLLHDVLPFVARSIPTSEQDTLHRQILLFLNLLRNKMPACVILAAHEHGDTWAEEFASSSLEQNRVLTEETIWYNDTYQKAMDFVLESILADPRLEHNVLTPQSLRILYMYKDLVQDDNTLASPHRSLNIPWLNVALKQCMNHESSIPEFTRILVELFITAVQGYLHLVDQQHQQHQQQSSSVHENATLQNRIIVLLEKMRRYARIDPMYRYIVSDDTYVSLRLQLQRVIDVLIRDYVYGVRSKYMARAIADFINHVNDLPSSLVHGIAAPHLLQYMKQIQSLAEEDGQSYHSSFHDTTTTSVFSSDDSRHAIHDFLTQNIQSLDHEYNHLFDRLLYTCILIQHSFTNEETTLQQSYQEQIQFIKQELIQHAIQELV